MQKKLWKYRDYVPNQKEIEELQTDLKISTELASLLVARGVYNFQTAKDFFRPNLQDIPNAFLMKNMEKAVAILKEHVTEEKNILVYGDYDVDGTSSVTILYKFLVQLTNNVTFYIPNRYTEGYGVSQKGIEYAIDNDIQLILTLDCGIKAHQKIQLARDNGIEVIVCDHHLPENELPNAIVLNPKQAECEYPFKDLAGVGVTYKLIQAYCQQENIPEEEHLRFLDFVALGTGADLVPLQGENRAYVYHGLEKINTNPSSGIKSIIQVAHCKAPITMKDIGFSIGPRINAAGRIGEASRIVDLFISGDAILETQLSKEINEENLYRRELDQESTKEALSILYSNEKTQYANVVYQPEWNKGIIGIVASRLLDHVYKPTIVLTKSGDTLTGSARSIQGFNIHDAIGECADILESYGGHAFAAGLTMHEKSLPAFTKKFNDICAKIQDKDLQAIIDVDLPIQLHQMDSKFFRILWQFEPFGMKNSDPVLTTSNLKLKSSIQVMGTKHIRFKVYQDDNPDWDFDVVGFNQIQHYDNIKSGAAMTICYTPELNHWQGRSRIQLNMKDIQFNFQ